jgi:hypothetical protein
MYYSKSLAIGLGILRVLRTVTSTTALSVERFNLWTVDCESRALILMGGYGTEAAPIM